MMLILNELPTYNDTLHPQDAALFSPDASQITKQFVMCRPNNDATPLVRLPKRAAQLRIAELAIKDEGFRLGLGSFKALGGAYAVMQLVLEAAQNELGSHIGLRDLFSPKVKGVAAGMVFGCATDGNHGRSVAQGARLVGAQSRIFVHSGVSGERIRAISDQGAEVIVVSGTYDDSVAEALRVCNQNGWTVVSDTSWPGYQRITGLVMQGYMQILDEALQQMEAPPTHVFIQAGVGGIAATLAAQMALRYGEARPRLVVVEPLRAACVMASALVGKIVKVEPGQATVMAMLECYEPSLVAWRVLSRVADAFMAVDEQEAVDAMKMLGSPLLGDPQIVSGESGAAGFAGLWRIANDLQSRLKIALNDGSRVLLISTEGATDRKRYEELTGLTLCGTGTRLKEETCATGSA